MLKFLTLYLIRDIFNAFANRSDPDQAHIPISKQSRPRSGSSLLAYGNMIRSR